MQYNLLLDTDSYKASHYAQFPPGTSYMFSYIESRGGQYPETVFFGLQYILKEYLSRRIEPWMLDEAEAFLGAHGEPFHRAGWQRIVRELGGRLPVRIRAVPEGSAVPTHNVLVTVESTDPETFWVVSYIETLLMRLWYPVTVATRSRAIKQILRAYLQKSADDPEAELPFKLHDFGARGASCREASGVGGMAHLVNFQGSDTLTGVRFANHYYRHPMAAFSIPAAEHATITSWGRDREVDAYRHIFSQFARPGGFVSVVSDSYDIYRAVDELWGDKLRDLVRDSGATLVIRPDSGEPVAVVSRVLQLIDTRFGSTVNRKGFRVLNGVRVIQGDAVEESTITAVLEAALALGYSASNLTFGMGGHLLQKLDRDTQKFAMKCSLVITAGREVPVYKEPVTDPGKRSKRGRLDLVRTATGSYRTIELVGPEPLTDSALVTVYEDGALLRDYALEEVRRRAEGQLE